MKIKTSELSGKALDYAVALCEGWKWRKCNGLHPVENYSPSSDWSQGGKIIEREKCFPRDGGRNTFVCNKYDDEGEQIAMQYGDTPLTAAMRCYVASKMGNSVEIPDELM